MKRARTGRSIRMVLLAVSLLPGMPATAGAAGLTPLPARTSDGVIRADLARLGALESRLWSGSSDRWRVAKARALVAAARTEYLENDRTGFDGAAFDEASRLAGDVASGAEPAAAGRVPASGPLAGTVRVREDLWARLDSLKASPGFDCALEELARAEVALLWAGNEQVDQGDCHSSPHVADAVRELRDAALLAEACRPAEPVALKEAPAVPLPAPAAPVPVPEIPTPEEVRIPRNVHFALDSYELSPRSLEVIAGIVRVLEKYPSITVRLEGHTDSRASAAYNLRLSKNRVNAVSERMVKSGIGADRITTAFRGEEALKVTEDSKANFARNRRVEMVFVDSEGHDIQAEEQEEDLQLESDPAPRPVKKPTAGTRR